MNIEETTTDTTDYVDAAVGFAAYATVFYASYRLGKKVSKKIKARKQAKFDREYIERMEAVVDSLNDFAIKLANNEI